MSVTGYRYYITNESTITITVQVFGSATVVHSSNIITIDSIQGIYRLLDSLVVVCWLRVRAVPGSIPSQGPRHSKDVIKMVPVVPLFGTRH